MPDPPQSYRVRSFRSDRTFLPSEWITELLEHAGIQCLDATWIALDLNHEVKVFQTAHHLATKPKDRVVKANLEHATSLAAELYALIADVDDPPSTTTITNGVTERKFGDIESAAMETQYARWQTDGEPYDATHRYERDRLGVKRLAEAAAKATLRRVRHAKAGNKTFTDEQRGLVVRLARAYARHTGFSPYPSRNRETDELDGPVLRLVFETLWEVGKHTDDTGDECAWRLDLSNIADTQAVGEILKHGVEKARRENPEPDLYSLKRRQKK